MGSMPNRRNQKKRLNKNQSVRIYREKQNKINLFRQQVEELTKKYNEIDSSTITQFQQFPLTDRTQKALEKCRYFTPTEIQKDSIGLALNGQDILGAAKTGSGKTLAFVIPVLECLFREGWSILDGLGAMIITPTRELAYQIFEVFNKVGENHLFSVALVIGGKDIAMERKLLHRCNIVICTPGRILQHMDENASFDTTNLKILVLDEADRILDLGFERTVNAILENLPQERQTLLFSATQTKSVKDLARLSLKNPVYVSVDEHAEHSTPEALEQSYLVCDAQTKMNLLWSFLKSHRNKKILVFMASCKEVKFANEIFCRMRPGLSVLALYGGLHQLRRMKIYDEFRRKLHAVMFATDIAARGLDFPDVNWVVQLDCPEDVNTYIHRVGRTARYEKGGEALLVLLPSEQESMVKQLQSKKIPINEIKVNPNKLVSVQKKMEALCAYDVNLKDSSQRAFKSYLKSIFLMKDKTIFDITKLDTEAYAKSLGMAFAPRIRFVEKRLKNAAKKKPQMFDSGDASLGENTGKTNNQDVSLSAFRMDDNADSDDEFLKPKGKVIMVDNDIDEVNIQQEIEKERLKKKPLTKYAMAKKALKKKIMPNTIIKFDEEGEPIQSLLRQQLVPIVTDLKKELIEEGYDIEKARQLLIKEDQIDKELYRQKIKEKHKAERIKQKEQSQKEPEPVAILGDPEDDSGGDSDPAIDPNNMSDSESERESNERQMHRNEESESDVDQKSDSETDGESSDRSSAASQKPILNSDECLPTGRKRVKKPKNKPNKTRKIYQGEHSDDDIGTETGLPVEEDESLALHFLTNT